MKNALLAAAAALMALPAISAPASALAHPRHRVQSCEHARRAHSNRGTVIGAIVGGLLGNRIAGRGSRTGGTIVGAGVGAVAGHEIARRNARCR